MTEVSASGSGAMRLKVCVKPADSLSVEGHLNYRDTRPLSFVGHKAFKLVERPAIQGSPLRLTSRNPITNPGQLFQGNRSSCALSLSYNAFADNVIDVSGEAAFFTRQLFEAATSAFCARAWSPCMPATIPDAISGIAKKTPAGMEICVHEIQIAPIGQKKKRTLISTNRH